MKVKNQSLGFSSQKPIVLTIGTFDGVHAGHSAVINVLKQKAREIGGETALLTFQPHPRVILHPDNHGLKLITDLNEKINLLEGSGLDHLIVEDFTLELAKKTPLEYVRKLLFEGIKPAVIVIGDDHRFGRNREGDFNSLKEMGVVFGFEVVALDAEYVHNVRVSSTKIREAIYSGNITDALELMNHPLPLSGIVVEGNRVGRTIGFPTANIRVSNDLKIIPSNGVYAVLARLKEQSLWLPAMLNIGHRPTVDNLSKPSIEVHIFNFDENCYKKEIEILFIDRIRDEKKFDSIDKLKIALCDDKISAIDRLKAFDTSQL